MKKFAARLAALGLATTVVVSAFPASSEASCVAGVFNSIPLSATTEERDSLSAGVNALFGGYIYATAQVNVNNFTMVASTEDTDAYREQMMKEAAKVDSEDISNLGVVTVDTAANVRTAPTTDASVAGKVYDKNVVTILTMENGWYKIESGNLKGYLRSDFLLVGNGEALKSAGTRYATINVDGLRVRKEPSLDAKVLGNVAKGEDIVVLDEKDGFVKVSIEEGDGWVSTDYVTLHTEYTFGETLEEEKARLKKEEEEREKARRAARRRSGGGGSGSEDYVIPEGGDGAAVASFALQFVGNPYVWGGSSLTRGTDCSGFVMSVYRQFGISLPHSSTSLRRVGYSVSVDEIKPGDIVCYSGHVAIYIGNGQIVHASNRRDGIKVSRFNYRRIICIRRIF
ncbi:MAG: SH3 domain-containing protein [Lachnospiraceae bacterium]|nr:SH3 domain-containing protein [Lachnospiraceae bacterium]